MPRPERMPVPIPEHHGDLWGRFPEETSKAYEAFLQYLKLSPIVRSIARAYRLSIKANVNDPIRTPTHFDNWATKYRWMERAKAYDDMVYDEELEQWETRRKAARERDWEQAEKLREIVDGALPSATQFFQRRVGQAQGGTPTIINADGQVIQQGTPSQVIVTVAFNVTDMTTVLEKASKIQRLTLNEPTDNVNNLTGAALDAALNKALGQWALDNSANGDETGDLEAVDDEDAYPTDRQAQPGDTTE